VQVPRQLSIVGYDDVMVSAYFDPPLTTVRQPMHEMGKAAMRLLVGLLRGEEVAPRAVMSGELVIRASTGPVPNRIL
jgi:DNA-binding LacI/PurR family transcriptional regulator